MWSNSPRSRPRALPTLPPSSQRNPFDALSAQQFDQFVLNIKHQITTALDGPAPHDVFGQLKLPPSPVHPRVEPRTASPEEPEHLYNDLETPRTDATLESEEERLALDALHQDEEEPNEEEEDETEEDDYIDEETGGLGQLRPTESEMVDVDFGSDDSAPRTVPELGGFITAAELLASSSAAEEDYDASEGELEEEDSDSDRDLTMAELFPPRFSTFVQLSNTDVATYDDQESEDDSITDPRSPLPGYAFPLHDPVSPSPEILLNSDVSMDGAEDDVVVELIPEQRGERDSSEEFERSDDAQMEYQAYDFDHEEEQPRIPSHLKGKARAPNPPSPILLPSSPLSSSANSRSSSVSSIGSVDLDQYDVSELEVFCVRVDRQREGLKRRGGDGKEIRRLERELQIFEEALRKAVAYEERSGRSSDEENGKGRFQKSGRVSMEGEQGTMGEGEESEEISFERVGVEEQEGQWSTNAVKTLERRKPTSKLQRARPTTLSSPLGSGATCSISPSRASDDDTQESDESIDYDDDSVPRRSTASREASEELHRRVEKMAQDMIDESRAELAATFNEVDEFAPSRDEADELDTEGIEEDENDELEVVESEVIVNEEELELASFLVELAETSQEESMSVASASQEGSPGMEERLTQHDDFTPTSPQMYHHPISPPPPSSPHYSSPLGAEHLPSPPEHDELREEMVESTSVYDEESGAEGSVPVADEDGGAEDDGASDDSIEIIELEDDEEEQGNVAVEHHTTVVSAAYTSEIAPLALDDPLRTELVSMLSRIQDGLVQVGDELQERRDALLVEEEVDQKDEIDEETVFGEKELLDQDGELILSNEVPSTSVDINIYDSLSIPSPSDFIDPTEPIVLSPEPAAPEPQAISNEEMARLIEELNQQAREHAEGELQKSLMALESPNLDLPVPESFTSILDPLASLDFPVPPPSFPLDASILASAAMESVDSLPTILNKIITADDASPDNTLALQHESILAEQRSLDIVAPIAPVPASPPPPLTDADFFDESPPIQVPGIVELTLETVVEETEIEVEVQEETALNAPAPKLVDADFMRSPSPPPTAALTIAEGTCEGPTEMEERMALPVVEEIEVESPTPAVVDATPDPGLDPPAPKEPIDNIVVDGLAEDVPTLELERESASVGLTERERSQEVEDSDMFAIPALEQVVEDVREDDLSVESTVPLAVPSPVAPALPTPPQEQEPTDQGPDDVDSSEDELAIVHSLPPRIRRSSRTPVDPVTPLAFTPSSVGRKTSPSRKRKSSFSTTSRSSGMELLATPEPTRRLRSASPAPAVTPLAAEQKGVDSSRRSTRRSESVKVASPPPASSPVYAEVTAERTGVPSVSRSGRKRLHVPDPEVEIAESPSTSKKVKTSSRAVDAEAVDSTSTSSSSASPRVHRHALRTAANDRTSTTHLPLTRSHCTYVKLRLSSLSNPLSIAYTFIVPSCCLSTPLAEETIKDFFIDNLGPSTAFEELSAAKLVGDQAEDLVADEDVRVALRRVVGPQLWEEGLCEMLPRAAHGRVASAARAGTPVRRSADNEGGRKSPKK